jgi:glycosyltransferase involved in cell wall biosynthesis
MNKEVPDRHICFVANSTLWSEHIGGAEVQSYLIASELVRRGWKVTYATPKDGTLSREKREHIQPIQLSEFPLVKMKSPIDVFKAIRHLMEINADVYYQRGENVLTFPSACAAKLRHAAFLWASSMDVDCVPGKFWNRFKDKFVIYDPRSLYKGLNAKIKDRVNEWSKKKADLVLVQTNANRQRLADAYGIEANIFPTVHALPVAAVKKISPPVILWLASLKEWKRPELFIELARACQDIHARFIMAGRAVSKKYPGRLLRMMEGLENIQYSGPLSFHESDALISKASIFVNTSEAQEGFPNTFIQSWMQGTFVLSLEVDPDGYLMEKGLGFKCDSIESMARKIKELLRNGHFSEKSEEIRNFAHENFNILNHIQRFESFLTRSSTPGG